MPTRANYMPKEWEDRAVEGLKEHDTVLRYLLQHDAPEEIVSAARHSRLILEAFITHANGPLPS